MLTEPQPEDCETRKNHDECICNFNHRFRVHQFGNAGGTYRPVCNGDKRKWRAKAANRGIEAGIGGNEREAKPNIKQWQDMCTSTIQTFG
jgi:hypothetical protein